jgi:superfamily II DNA/RNA helicase
MTSFNDLALDPRVLSAVAETGYTTPTPIQIQAIPHALEGRDVLGIAQTGTGKTASFTLPMITLLQQGRARARMPRSLVIAPTRELAAQVAENFETYAKNVKLTMALLIGGVSFKDQDKLIDRGVDVLIATPGRLLDHFERGKLMLTGVQIMVVDEADRMLDMGFIPDIERIFKLTPFTRQTLFFSATMPPEITRLTQEFLHNPVRVEVARQATAAETIDQWVIRHAPSRKDRADSEKREVLRRLIRGEGEALTNGIIFCNRKRDVDVVAKSLKKHGFDAAGLHGDLDQSVRTRILGGFREGDLKLLVASDVAARGLDIPNVSHVINFDVPIHSEDYVHRIGRTGRAGRKGKSVTICLPHEGKYLEKIEELVANPIPVVESPLGGAEPQHADAADAEEPGERPRGEGRRRRTSRSVPPTGPVEQAAPRPSPAPAPAASPAREGAGERRNVRRRGGGREADRPVHGLGDHVPAFLLRDFRPALEETEAQLAAEPEDATVTPNVETEAEAPKAAAPRKSRRRKAEPAAEASPEASSVSEAGVSEADVSGSGEDEAGEARAADGMSSGGAAPAETEAAVKPGRTVRRRTTRRRGAVAEAAPAA